MAAGRVWGGYPRISGFGFRFWVLVCARGFSGLDTRNLTGLGRILIFTHGSTVGAPESSTRCQARQLTQLGHTRLAAGALLRMGQSKAARPEAAPTGVDRPEAGPWPKSSRQPARGRVQQLQSKQRAQQGFTAQPVSAQPHTVKQYRMVCELFSGFG